MKVLVACEFSGIVRDAFLKRGHDAVSCDLLPSEMPGPHIQGNVLKILDKKWDLMIAHPPCQFLANSGARWLYNSDQSDNEERWEQLEKAAKFFSVLWNADIPRIAIENPVMHKHAKKRIKNYQPFTQTVQPWQFAQAEESPDNVKKRTCLWLKNLPKLKPTGRLDGSTARPEIHHATPSPDRWKIRSKFFPGIASAMAHQWG